jgi:glutamyl-tRNA reductase
MRVAAGLDSMILGEPQILGQVSRAQAEARAAGTTGPLLSHLFERASHAGKRARTETEIGRHTTSISHAAVRLVRDKLGDLDRTQLLVVGAGEMAEVAAQALINHGARQLNFINRTYARAEQLARQLADQMAGQFEGRALNWYQLPAALAMADVVVTATGAPHIVIHENDVLPILPERGGRPLLFVDIALPRDVEESVGDLEGVQRFDIDHLQSTVDANLAQRRSAIPDVETIIVDEANSFEEWLKGRQVLPVLVELRRKAREIAELELSRHSHQLNEFAPEGREKVSRIVYRIVNKLLHGPSVSANRRGATPDIREY